MGQNEVNDRKTNPEIDDEAGESLLPSPLRSRQMLRWVVIIGGIGLALLLALIVVFSECGMPEPPPLPDPINPPERVAVQNEAIRRLILNVGQSRLCDQLRGQLLPLPARDASLGREGGASAATGRFWIERCEASPRDDHLTVHLEGRGWTWANETRAGPMGSSFAVHGYLRVLISVDLEGELDLGYDDRRQVASVWLSPARAPNVHLSVQGDLPVQAQSGWSGIIGVLGQVIGDNVESRARPVVEQFGANEIARRLTPGLTVTDELCTGQLDLFLGALGNGETPTRPYPRSNVVWVANQRVQINEGGFDVAGAFDSEGRALRVDLEVEQGAVVDARLYCEAQARTVIESYLQRRPAPPLPTVVTRTIASGRRETINVPSPSCPLVLVVTPRSAPDGSGGVARYRYRVVVGDGAPEPIVHCNP